MKIGVSAFAWTSNFGLQHLRLLPLMRDQGFDGFEIPMFDPARIACSEIRRAFEASGLECTVCAILPEGINPISADAAVRRKSVEHLRTCIEASAELGAHLLGGPLFAPIGYFIERRRSDEEWRWAVDVFQNLGDLLDAHDLILSIEPVNRSETFFLRTASDAKTLCEEIGHPRIGVTIDTFHANIEEKSIPRAVQEAGNYLKHVHVSENDRGLLGTGHVDFPSIISILQQLDYKGYLTIEGFGCSPNEPQSLGNLWGDPNVTPEDIAVRGLRYLRQLL